MNDPIFTATRAPMSVADICAVAGIEAPADPAVQAHAVKALAPLDRAGPGDLSFLDGARYVPQFRTSQAGVCLTSERFADLAPDGMIVLKAPRPYAAFVAVARHLFSDTLRPGSIFGHDGVASGAFVHPQARLEADVTVDPGAVIGPGAEIGTGTVIAAGAIIGPAVRVGRDCSVGAGASLLHALVGNRVIIHPGARIGQDGFGYLSGPDGHGKVPQLGRVVLQDDVEIGAGTTIDRGGIRDTVIGEGTKIDNLVQIAHNVVIGRHCIVVSQTGIAGSATLGDYVVLGGQVGVIGHVTIGAGSQIAASSNVKHDVPPGVQWGGSPAKPMREWFREVMAVQRLGRAGSGATAKAGRTEEGRGSE